MLSEGMLFHDRYELKRRLGQGGFSEVWLALDTKVNHDVAVKVYAPGTGLDDEAVSLFMQEFSLVYDLNHTNLLKPTSYDDCDNVPYLILPYCRQGSIYKFVMRGERISEDQCWHLLHDVAAGLAFLHEQVPPIIHRDIKPDNILVSDNGNFMITDFGISASIQKTIHRSNAEQSTGTLAYMAPECFSANPKPVMASDIWALGATMFEVMTADIPPFGNHGGLIQRNGAEIPVIDEPYSDELKQIIYQCLAKDPWERPRAHDIAKLTYEHIEGIADTLHPGKTRKMQMPETPASMQETVQMQETPASMQETVQMQETPAAMQETVQMQENPAAMQETVQMQETPASMQETQSMHDSQPEVTEEQVTEIVEQPKKKKPKKKKEPQKEQGISQQTVTLTDETSSETDAPESAPFNPSKEDSQPSAQKSLPITSSKPFWIPLVITCVVGLLAGILLHIIIPV